MRAIFIQRHSNGLTKELTTFNPSACRRVEKKRTIVFYDYACRRDIEIVDVTKKPKQLEKKR